MSMNMTPREITIVSERVELRTSTLQLACRGRSFQVVIRADWGSLRPAYTLELSETGPGGGSEPIGGTSHLRFGSSVEAREMALATIAALVEDDSPDARRRS